MDFKTNRTEQKTFIAEIINDKLLSIHLKERKVLVQYYGLHHDKHMWKDIDKNYLAYYETDIKLLKETDVKIQK